MRKIRQGLREGCPFETLYNYDWHPKIQKPATKRYDPWDKYAVIDGLVHKANDPALAKNTSGDEETCSESDSSDNKDYCSENDSFASNSSDSELDSEDSNSEKESTPSQSNEQESNDELDAPDEPDTDVSEDSPLFPPR